MITSVMPGALIRPLRRTPAGVRPRPCRGSGGAPSHRSCPAIEYPKRMVGAVHVPGRCRATAEAEPLLSAGVLFGREPAIAPNDLVPHPQLGDEPLAIGREVPSVVVDLRLDRDGLVIPWNGQGDGLGFIRQIRLD